VARQTSENAPSEAVWRASTGAFEPGCFLTAARAHREASRTLRAAARRGRTRGRRATPPVLDVNAKAHSIVKIPATLRTAYR
jgi:hypothetical protein